MMRKDADVIIAGAGPAGSTAACLLARAGVAVRVLERARFPRFRIGESLLPAELPVFERLGFAPDRTISVRKMGALFLDEASGRERTYLFADGLAGTRGEAMQVERAGFDEALLARVRAAGAEALEGERVREVEVREDRVRVRTDAGEHAARYFVDATGQQALLARQHRGVEPIEGFGRAAAFAHFEGIRSDVAGALAADGNNVQVLIRPDGWAWVIPLPGQRLSIGVVSTERGLTAGHLDSAVAGSERLRWLTEGSRRGEVRMVGNYSFRNRRRHGPRFACVGDAACFLDPVFSSGVALAMVGAERLADRLAPALARGDEARADLLDPLAAHMDHAYGTFGALIDRFYHTRFTQHFLLHEDPDPELRAGLITVLAGDLWREDNRFQNMILAATRRRPGG
jgi:flavin-dependent dehydrogenase